MVICKNRNNAERCLTVAHAVWKQILICVEKFIKRFGPTVEPRGNRIQLEDTVSCFIVSLLKFRDSLSTFFVLFAIFIRHSRESDVSLCFGR